VDFCDSVVFFLVSNNAMDASKKIQLVRSRRALTFSRQLEG